MNIRAIPACVLVLFLALPVFGQVEGKSPYLDSDALNKTIRGIVKSNTDKQIRLLVVGKTREGREILGLELRAQEPKISNSLPANIEARKDWQSGLLLISGLESDALIGSSTLIGIVEHLTSLSDEDLAAMLADRKLIVIPRVDHDGTERYFTSNQGNQQAGNARIIDWDRDGRSANEDAPTDINQDGLVTLMRQKHPKGEWIDDPENPGQIRLAKADEGELGTYRVFPESLDQDEDGDFGEDGHAGVRLDQNFAHAFKEHSLPSGPHAMSESATRSLTDFVLARPWIENVLVYGTHDNIHTLPKSGKAKPSTGRRGRSPVTKPHAEDIKILESIHKLAKKEGAAAESRIQTVGGSFEDWTYFHLGLPSAAINLFDAGVTPKAAKKEKGETSSATSQPSKVVSIDSTLAQPNTLYVPWSSFDHPVLGQVEIGGWRPFVRNNPHSDAIPTINEKQLVIVEHLLGQSAKLELTDISCKKLTDALFEINCSIVNQGTIASQSVQSTRCRASRPDLLILEIDQDQILHGQKLNRVPALAAGSGRQHFRWLVKGNSGRSLNIHLAASRRAPSTKEIKLP